MEIKQKMKENKNTKNKEKTQRTALKYHKLLWIQRSQKSALNFPHFSAFFFTKNVVQKLQKSV